MKKIIYTLISLLIFVSCIKEDPDTIVLETSDNMELEQNSGTAMISFTASGNWSASVDSDASGWCTINKSTGQGGSCSITVTLAENTCYDDRSATITIVSGTAEETFTVTQKQKDAILIGDNEFITSGEQNYIGFKVNSNVDFQIEISVDWIFLTGKKNTRALSEDSITFKIAPNPFESERTGTISLKYEDIVQTITVCQAVRGNKMSIELEHSQKELYPLEFQGNNVLGMVDWGDGCSTAIGQNHVYEDSAIRRAVYEVKGADSFTIKSLDSISSIVICCDEENEE